MSLKKYPSRRDKWPVICGVRLDAFFLLDLIAPNRVKLSVPFFIFPFFGGIAK